MKDLADAIDALLPQTQCGKCGFNGCRPYAEAIAAGASPINRCPPGGEAGIRKLASLLNTPRVPLDPTCGHEKPPGLALIREEHCIGCTLCIQAWPMDAIVGAPKRMHTVLLAHCTGCELCRPPCPVDCIELVKVHELVARGVAGARERSALNLEELATRARARFMAHVQRETSESVDVSQDAHSASIATTTECSTIAASAERKRQAIAQALTRARSRRALQ